jgi:hypothetical protein
MDTRSLKMTQELFGLSHLVPLLGPKHKILNFGLNFKNLVWGFVLINSHENFSALIVLDHLEQFTASS